MGADQAGRRSRAVSVTIALTPVRGTCRDGDRRRLGRVTCVTRVRELLAGRYELEARIGAGGMGEVYRAHDRLLGRTVAVKLPAASVAQDPVARAWFRREAWAAAGSTTRTSSTSTTGTKSTKARTWCWSTLTAPACGQCSPPRVRSTRPHCRTLRRPDRRRGRCRRGRPRRCPPRRQAEQRTVAADGSCACHRLRDRERGPADRSVDPVTWTLGDPITQPGTVIVLARLPCARAARGSSDRRAQRHLLAGRVARRAARRRSAVGRRLRRDHARRDLDPRDPVGLRPVPDDDSAGLRRVVARATADDPAARHQRAGDLRDELLAIADRLGTGREPADVEPEVVPPAPAWGVGTDRTAPFRGFWWSTGPQGDRPEAAACTTAPSPMARSARGHDRCCRWFSPAPWWPSPSACATWHPRRSRCPMSWIGTCSPWRRSSRRRG